jgi:L(+)-tartrate dehydratase beta subunit
MDYIKIYDEILKRFPKENRLNTPLSEADVLDLELGDVVYFNGTIFTGREKALQRLLDDSIMPFNIKEKSNVMMTSAPGVKELGPNRYEARAAMPTTNYRFIKWLPMLFEKCGLRALISKGGLQRDAYTLLHRYHAINVIMVAPAITAIYAMAIRAIKNMFWVEEFRTTDALYVFEIENLGPFIVEGDVNGNSLYKDIIIVLDIID